MALPAVAKLPVPVPVVVALASVRGKALVPVLVLNLAQPPALVPPSIPARLPVLVPVRHLIPGPLPAHALLPGPGSESPPSPRCSAYPRCSSAPAARPQSRRPRSMKRASRANPTPEPPAPGGSGFFSLHLAAFLQFCTSFHSFGPLLFGVHLPLNRARRCSATSL